jgi:hypothetical protein
MRRSLALTGIALIAASVVTGCRGSHAATLAAGPDPIAGRSRIFHGDDPRPGRHIRHPRGLARRAPATRHRRHALPSGCKRVAGGLECFNTRGVDRDWVINDGDQHPTRNQDPIRSLIDPKD